jgi:IclR family pca regulon transcriptional regulator
MCDYRTEGAGVTEEHLLDSPGDPDFMSSLARGLAVLRCFAEQQRPMTIAQASIATGLSRAAVRRCLYTLAQLGYAAQEGPSYVLRPKTLALGYAYLSSNSLLTRAQPILDQVRDQLHESCSLGVVEEDDVFYAARAEASRIMSVALQPGSRLPLYATSMGRVLLAGLARSERETYLRRVDLVARTPRTVTDPHEMLALLDKVAEEGFAIVDQELELGLRSVAVPVLNSARATVAAINIGTQAARVPMAILRSLYLPVLRGAAEELRLTGLT